MWARKQQNDEPVGEGVLFYEENGVKKDAELHNEILDEGTPPTAAERIELLIELGFTEDEAKQFMEESA